MLFLYYRAASSAMLLTANAMSESRATRRADVACGIVSVRAVFETAVETLWIIGSCGDHEAARKMTVTAMLQDVLNDKNCPGLLNYLAVAAEDNEVAYKTVLAQAKKLYSTASPRLHSEAAAATGESSAFVPTDVFLMASLRGMPHSSQWPL